MVSYIELKGFEEFDKYMENLEKLDHKGQPVILYFSGAKLSDGKSWCPDCNDAEPVVKAYLTEINKSLTFAYVDVGDQKYWSNRACPFRTDKRTKLMVIPTIIKWQGVQRLEGEQCSKRDLLQMLFEEDE